MAYKSRLALLILLDSIIVSIAIFIAFWIVYPYSTSSYYYFNIGFTSASLLNFHNIYALIYSLYNKVWAYASVGELVAIVKAVTLTVISAGIIQLLVNNFVIYRRALIV